MSQRLGCFNFLPFSLCFILLLTKCSLSISPNDEHGTSQNKLHSFEPPFKFISGRAKTLTELLLQEKPSAAELERFTLLQKELGLSTDEESAVYIDYRSAIQKEIKKHVVDRYSLLLSTMLWGDDEPSLFDERVYFPPSFTTYSIPTSTTTKREPEFSKEHLTDSEEPIRITDLPGITFPSTIYSDEWKAAWSRLGESILVRDAWHVHEKFPKKDPTQHIESRVQPERQDLRERWGVIIWELYQVNVEPISWEALEFQRLLVDAMQLLRIRDFRKLLEWRKPETVAKMLNEMYHIPAYPLPLNFAMKIRGAIGYYFAEKLIFMGAPINHPDMENQTPLILAAQNGRIDMVALLLGNSADIHAKDKHGRNALHHAIVNQHSEIVRRLLAWGASADERSGPLDGGRTPLHYALQRSDNAVRALLEYRATVGLIDAKGEEHTRIAVGRKSVDIVQALLNEKSFDRAILYPFKDHEAMHPLFVAFNHRFSEKTIFTLLDVEIATRNTQLICAGMDDDGRTLLWWAAKNLLVKVGHRLLDYIEIAIQEKYAGYENCNSHTGDKRGRSSAFWFRMMLTILGFSALEILVTSHRDVLFTQSVGSFMRRLYRSRDPTSGQSYLIQAVFDPHYTLRKVATLTFASATTAKDAIYLPPPNLNMDDFMLTVPLIPIDQSAIPSIPLWLALRHGRRRSERLLFRALAASVARNINVFASWKAMIISTSLAVELQNNLTLTFISNLYPQILEEAITVASPGDPWGPEAQLQMIQHLPPEWKFTTTTFSPLENVVLMSLSPRVPPSMPAFHLLISPKHVKSSSFEDVEKALALIHVAGKYFSKMPSYIPTLNAKIDTIVEALFRTPIIEVNRMIPVVSFSAAWLCTLFLMIYLFIIVCICTDPAVYTSARDPLSIIPSPSSSITEGFRIAFLRLFGRQAWTKGHDWSLETELKSLWSVFPFHAITMFLLLWLLISNYEMASDFSIPLALMFFGVLFLYFVMSLVIPRDCCILLSKWFDTQYKYEGEELANPNRTFKSNRELQKLSDLITSTLWRQFKIPPIEYLQSNSFALLLSAVPTMLPNVGGFFQARYVSIYKNRDLFEMYRAAPFKATGLEFLWSIVLFRLVFLLFRPLVLILLLIKQRARIVEAMGKIPPQYWLHYLRKPFLRIKLTEDEIMLMDAWVHTWIEALKKTDDVWRSLTPTLGALVSIILLGDFTLFEMFRFSICIARSRIKLFFALLTLSATILCTSIIINAWSFNRDQKQSTNWIRTRCSEVENEVDRNRCFNSLFLLKHATPTIEILSIDVTYLGGLIATGVAVAFLISSIALLLRYEVHPSLLH